MYQRRELFFGNRSKFEAPFIFIRECYRTMYDMVMQHLIPETRFHLAFVPTNVIITGTPGIGKTHFSIYFAWRLFKDIKVNGIMLATVLDTVNLLDKVSGRATDGEIPLGDVVAPHNSSYFRLVDLEAREEPRPFNKGPNIVFASPDVARFKELKKHDRALSLVMPIFDLDEMEQLRSACFTHQSVERTSALMAVYGGIPRFVLSKEQSSSKRGAGLIPTPRL